MHAEVSAGVHPDVGGVDLAQVRGRAEGELVRHGGEEVVSVFVPFVVSGW